MTNQLGFSVRSERGTGIMEILVSMVLLAIAGMGVTMSMSTAMKTAKYTEYNHIASSLAVSKLELLAAVNVNFLTTAQAGTESAVAWPNSSVTFRRVTTVVVNADNSRSVTVSVSPNDANYAMTVSFSNQYALWE